MNNIDAIELYGSVENDGKGYCSLSVDAESALKIYEYVCSRIGNICPESEPVEPHAMHVTLMYDRRGSAVIPQPNKPSKLVYTAHATDLKFLGPAGKKRRAIVLELSCPELMERFKELCALGFEHSYENLTLHTTMVYGANEEDMMLFKGALENGELPITIELCDEHWEDLE